MVSGGCIYGLLVSNGSTPKGVALISYSPTNQNWIQKNSFFHLPSSCPILKSRRSRAPKRARAGGANSTIRRDEPTNNGLLHRCDHAIDPRPPMNRFTFQSAWTHEDLHIAGLADDCEISRARSEIQLFWDSGISASNLPLLLRLNPIQMISRP